MHCPQCGQQQAADIVRFCSRCGFPLDGVMQLLANGGALPILRADQSGTNEISPRRKGVKQGGLLFLSGALVVPAMGVLYGWTDVNIFGFLTALAAVLLFLGGALRMLYAGLFEEGAQRQFISTSYLPPRTPAQMGPPMRGSALPPNAANPASGWRPRPNTAEILQPPSVTESTTRLLDDQDDRRSNN